jgi:hypothetical protein
MPDASLRIFRYPDTESTLFRQRKTGLSLGDLK